MKPPKHIPKPVRKTGGARATKLSDQMATPTVEVAASQAAHFDNDSVEQFAAAMKAKLAKKRDEGRGGWEDKEQCSNAFLSRLLVEHVQKGDPVDVGNLAMMIHQRGEGIGVASGNASAIAQLNAIVDAWEALPGGRQVKNSDVERWLATRMGPGIDAIRGFLRRPRPDGILPPPPQPISVGGHLRAQGIGRDPENDRVVFLSLNRAPSDDELRAIQDAIGRTPATCPFCSKPTYVLPCSHCGEPDVPDTDF
jgi:hypothetical protein